MKECTTFREFLKELFKGTVIDTDYAWDIFEGKLVGEPKDRCRNVGSDLLVEIRIVTSGVHEHYTGISVDLCNREHGCIATVSLRFDDYFDREGPGVREDQRKLQGDRFSIIQHCGKDWYINTPQPADRHMLANSANAYIRRYIPRR